VKKPVFRVGAELEKALTIAGRPDAAQAVHLITPDSPAVEPSI
jgi:hypothetical protein